ncbi:MAG: protein translocase subunit SecD [Planctomycetota bacterium]|nr:protein translocase subunit SecD [Planctomycetota bacterium]
MIAQGPSNVGGIPGLPGTGAGAAPLATDWVSGITNLAVMGGAVLIPFLLSKLAASRLKMPAHLTAFYLIILSVLSTALILGLTFFNPAANYKQSFSSTDEKKPFDTQFRLKFGPEIVGGTNLIYQIDRSTEGNSKVKILAKDFMFPLVNRLNPSGTKELLIRPIGEDQIEITIPDVDETELAEIKRQITETGILQFRIVANRNDHQGLFDLATAQANSPDQNVRVRRDIKMVDKTTNEERVIGMWRTLGRGVEIDGIRQVTGYQPGDLIRNSQTGRLISPPAGGKANDFEKWLASQKIIDVDVLLATERAGKLYSEVNGSDLATAKKSISSKGGYEVNFKMTVGGGDKLMRLTGANLPSGDHFRRMAILLDGRILSAPQLNSTIRSEGLIEGRFTEKEVDFLVGILNSGALPGALTKTPISENTVGASMGRDAIAKAEYASGISLIVTILCVLLYYRFSGIVATFALLLNLGMILACMIVIKQPLTLSGIAGLVLSVGMSVDANVLVFERIREETEKNATPRMAIRNGFDRAWTTIFDSNLTTLITAVVLYFVGTEQIKGFAITLIIGLVISLFTAVFVTHKLFEVAEKWKFLSLGMMDYVNTARKSIFGDKDVDFMKYRFACYTGSLILIIGGLIATALRGNQILDIDFNGGVSVVFTLDKGTSVEDVREISDKVFETDSNGLPIQTTLTNVEMSGHEKNTVYKLDVSIKDKDDVTSRLVKGFKESGKAGLVNYDVFVKPVANPQSDSWSPKRSAKLISFQEPGTANPNAAAAPGAEVKTDGDVKAEVPADDSVIKSSFDLEFKSGKGDTAKMNAMQVSEKLIEAAESIQTTLVPAQIEMVPKNATGWTTESLVGYEAWTVTLPFDSAKATAVIDKMKETIRSEPVFESVSTIESRVAGEMQRRAIAGLLLSLVFIVGYIWFRFQKLAYGIAAVVALVHDVLITLAFIAVSHWLFKPFGFLLIEDFKVSLTTIAGFLTIIGYSLNDTIVVFDRIREVKGKSQNLTEQMINASVTQTLSRTLLTSSTTILAILLMYMFGGEGIHGFAYCLFVGIVVGTYSSIFIASPILVWFVQREQAAKLAGKVSSR